MKESNVRLCEQRAVEWEKQVAQRTSKLLALQDKLAQLKRLLDARKEQSSQLRLDITTGQRMSVCLEMSSMGDVDEDTDFLEDVEERGRSTQVQLKKGSDALQQAESLSPSTTHTVTDGRCSVSCFCTSPLGEDGPRE